jgi:hypothetical protein
MLEEHRRSIDTDAKESHMTEAQISGEPADQVPALRKDDEEKNLEEEREKVGRGLKQGKNGESREEEN